MRLSWNKLPVIQPDDHELIRALVELKAQPGGLFDKLAVGLHTAFDPELAILLRAPPEFMAVAQGRSQKAQELLVLVDNIDWYREELKRIEATMKLAGKPINQG